MTDRPVTLEEIPADQASRFYAEEGAIEVFLRGDNGLYLLNDAGDEVLRGLAHRGADGRYYLAEETP